MKQMYVFFIAFSCLLFSLNSNGQEFTHKENQLVERTRTNSEYEKIVKFNDLFNYPTGYDTKAHIADSSNVTITFNSTDNTNLFFDRYLYSQYSGQYFYFKVPAGGYGIDTLAVNINYNSEDATSLVIVKTVPLNCKADEYTINIGDTTDLYVLSNDNPKNFLDTNTFEIIHNVTLGTAVISQDGSIQYMNDAMTNNYSLDSLIYRIADNDGNYDTATVKISIHGNPYVTKVFDYLPAPGQFVNTVWADTAAGKKIIGNNSGGATLGGFGGYVIAGFDQPIVNRAENAYGVDFTIKGNAFSSWSEPAAVQVMKDENGNGLPDDQWYELAGSDYHFESSVKDLKMTYINPKYNGRHTLPFNTNKGFNGAMRTNGFHKQSYYPDPYSFNISIDSVSYTGTFTRFMLDKSNPGMIVAKRTPAFGYADARPANSNTTVPRNPYFSDENGAAADGFDLEWAVDENGNKIDIDTVHFVKVYSTVQEDAGWLGEVSPEIFEIGITTPDPNYMPQDYKFHYIGAGRLQVLKGTNYQYEGLLFKNGIPQSGTRHWVSDSTHVATIDENGLLTAIDNGQTTIHFWVDENVQKDSIVVEVVELEEIFIELEAMSSNNNDTLYLVEGEYEYIYTEAQDNRVGARNRFAYETYTYNNSDDNVGTIDNGIFYAKNVGQTKIVVRSVHDPSLSDSALIIVGEAPEITAIKDTVEISYLERQGVFEMTDLFENEMDALMTLKAVDHTSDFMNINMVNNSIKYSINFDIFGYEEVTFDIEIFGHTKEVTIVFNALEPAFFKNILFVNGGEFMNNAAPTQLMSYLPGSKTTVKLDQYIAGATSVQDMVVDGNYAFVSADYYITRYDVETGEAIDSVYTQDNSAVIADGQGTEGAGVNNKMALYENMLLATRQSSSSAPEDGYNVRIYNKGDLSLIKKIGVSDQATDVAVHNDTAYVMINGGFAGTTSSLAVIDLKTLTLNREIDLGEDGLGVMQMQVKDNKIYCIRLSDAMGSKYNSGIVIYDIATGSVTEYEYTAGIPYDSSPLSIEPYTGDTIFVKKDLGYVAFNTENNTFGTDIHFEIPSYYIQDLDHIGKGSVYDPEDERYYVAYAYWHGTGVGQIYNNEFDSIGYFDSVGASPEVIKVCKVFESNQAPVVNNPAGEYFYKDSANVDITLPVDLFTDYEDVYPAVYLHNPAANLWLNYDNKTGILTGKYNNPVTDSTTISVPLQGIDMQGAYAIDTLKITIFPGNPVIVENPITDVLVNEDANDTTIDISGVFTDPDDDDELINLSVVSNSNSSLLNATLDSKIITLSFNSDENGSAEIVVQGELNGYIATDTFNVTVTPVDDAPFVANGIADIYASQHSSDSIIDLSGVFSDIDNDDASITKSVKSNSNSAIVTASISGNDLTLSFIDGATGEAEIIIEGVSNDKSAYDTVLVTVVADIAPVVANPIADINVTENAADSVITLENVFTDADNDDTSITKSVKSNSNSAIVTASISGNDLTLSFIADATGEAEIVIEGVSNGKAVTDTFTVTITPVTGIENTTIANVVLYPNPSNGIFRVKTESGDIGSIKVFNVNGTLIYSNEHYTSGNEIDISNQPVGQYFISVKIGNVNRTESIIKE